MLAILSISSKESTVCFIVVGATKGTDHLSGSHDVGAVLFLDNIV